MMVNFITCVVLMLLTAILVLILFEPDNASIFIILICLIIGAGFGLYGEIQSKNNNEWKVEHASTEPIVALQDNHELNGRFYLRSGYINEKEYYYYLVKLNNGGYKTNKISADAVTIFEADSNYRIEWYTRTKGFWFTKQNQTFQYIYVPKNAIEFDFSINLE